VRGASIGQLSVFHAPQTGADLFISAVRVMAFRAVVFEDGLATNGVALIGHCPDHARGGELMAARDYNPVTLTCAVDRQTQ
jgi:hypothetical protein